MSALEEAALAYAEQGLHVFPLQPQGKTPLTAHGLEDATTDALTIETWWARWPDANVAIRTGEIIVVDEDRFGALDELAAEAHETIPETRIVKTGSGRHFYFLPPADQRIRNTAGKLAPGIDTRGDGGYVVAPPSVHPSGSIYEYLAQVDAVILPAWIAQRLIRAQPERKPMPDINLIGTSPYGKAALDEEIARVALASEGTRNDTLNRAAFALGQLVAGGEVDQVDAWRSLEGAASAAGLPINESGKTIRSGFQAGLAEPRKAPESNLGGALRGSTEDRSLRLVTDAVTETEPERDSWVPLNLNDLPETPPVKPDLGGTNLVYPGKRHVFSGPPESAKTLAAYCILIQIARGGGNGILIDFEMGGYDARKRLTELGATRGEIDRILYIEPEVPANVARIRPLIELNPQLVVIDAGAGVYALEGLDDNKRGDVEKVASIYIKSFWRAMISTILIDHVVKDNEARGRFVIGSERKLGGADVHLGFETMKEISRGTAGKYKITTHKDRGGYLKRGYLADLNLDSDPQTHNIAWSFTEPVIVTDDHGEMRPSIKMEQISNKLTGLTERLTVNEVKDLIGGNRKMAGRAINLMVNEGYLDAEDGPRGSKHLLLTRPYSADSDPLMGDDSDPLVPPVPVWFSSGSGTGEEVTGSLGPPPYGGSQSRTAVTGDSESAKNDDRFPGWLNDDGGLVAPPNEDVDWTS